MLNLAKELQLRKSSQKLVIPFVVLHVANDEANEVNQGQDTKKATEGDEVKQDQYWATAQVHTVYSCPANEKRKEDGECCIVLSSSQAFEKHAGFFAKIFDFGEEAAFFRFFLHYMTACSGGSSAVLGRARVGRIRDSKRRNAGQHKH